jgi:hypothetical protein
MTPNMPGARRGPVPGTVELLRSAREQVSEEFDLDPPMLAAAQHLISCAADIVGALPGSDLETAREALAAARAATGIAGYVVRRMGDEIRLRA